MASTKTRIKPIRIKNDTADYFENKPLNRMVESLEEMLKTGKVRFDGENLVVKGGSDSNADLSDLSDLSEMADLMRVSTEKILSDIKEFYTYIFKKRCIGNGGNLGPIKIFSGIKAQKGTDCIDAL